MSATFIQSNVNRPERHDMTVTAMFAGKIVTKSVSMDYDARVSLSDRTLRHRHLHPNDTNSKATRHIVIPRSAKGERGEVNRFKVIGLGCATYTTKKAKVNHALAELLIVQPVDDSHWTDSYKNMSKAELLHDIAVANEFDDAGLKVSGNKADLVARLVKHGIGEEE